MTWWVERHHRSIMDDGGQSIMESCVECKGAPKERCGSGMLEHTLEPTQCHE